MSKRDLLIIVVVLFVFGYFIYLSPSISLSPPDFFDHYTKNIAGGANPTIASYAKVSWDGSTNYVRSGAGTGSLDGTFTSKPISIGSSTSNIKVSWVGSSDVTVRISTNNWVSSCYAVNGQYINDPGCPLPASSFIYRVKLPDAVLPSKIDSIQFAFNSPVTCGNNIIEGTEQCDGSSLNGQSCSSLGQGFSGGTLSCIVAGQPNQCQFNTSACTLPICGNGVIETGETCDDANLNNGDGCSNVCNIEGGWKCRGEPSRCFKSKLGKIMSDDQIASQCSDGIDNDGDGAIDYLLDFSCSSTGDADESNPKSQCQNGIDDDGNGFVDFPFDTGCASLQDNEEFGGSSAGVCGNGVIESPEVCDDFNQNNGDGCSLSCSVESGYTCSGEPSLCSQTNVNLECPVGYCLPRDSNGWTVYTPSADSHFVYVSNVGNDNTCRAYTLAEVGDPYNPTNVIPCASINISLSKLRNDMPDWLLLKRGDSWHSSLGEADYNNPTDLQYTWRRTGGRSYNEPMVVTTYGSSNQRPILYSAGTSGFQRSYGSINPPNVQYLAINGISFIADKRIGFYDAVDGFGWGGPGSNILIEDCKFEQYYHAVAMSAVTNLTIRRSALLDSWTADYSKVSGAWAEGVKQVLFQENIIDRNGYNSDFPFHDLVFLPGQSLSTWTSVNNGKFDISIFNPTGGGSYSFYSIDSVDFSSATSLSEVAIRIQNAINAKAGANVISVSAFFYSRTGLTYFLIGPYNSLSNQPIAQSIGPYTGSVLGGTNLGTFNGGYFNDRGGWAYADQYRHNTYMAYNAGNRDVYFLNNIVSRASAHGLFFSDKGMARGNLIVRNPLAIVTLTANVTLEDNVILESQDIVSPKFSGDLRAASRGMGLLVGPGPDDGTGTKRYSGPATIKNNIFAHTSYSSSNILGIAFGTNPPALATNISILGNIIYNWSLPTTGQSILIQDLAWEDHVLIKNNIFQEPTNHGSESVLIAFDPINMDQNHFKFSNNTYYMTGSSNWFTIGSVKKTFAQWQDFSGESDAVNNKVSFFDPSRTIESYSLSLGKPATFDAFINEVRTQSRYNWRTEYTAPVVNQYIRDGFAVGGGCGPLGCSPEISKGNWFTTGRAKGLFIIFVLLLVVFVADIIKRRHSRKN